MEKEITDSNQNANRKAITFVAKLLVLYVLFSQGNIFMNGVFSEGGNVYNAFLANHFDYVQGLKSALIIPAVWLIKISGFYAIHNQSDVMVVDGPYIQVAYDCLGLGVMSFLAAFVIAFPAKLKPKLKLLVFGFVLIYLLNVLRITGLAVLMTIFSSQRDNFTYHHEIFNILVYVCLFIVIYYWIKKNTGPISTSPTNRSH